MKILHVEMGRHMYGGALQVEYLMRGLAAEGIENILVCSRDSAIARTGHADTIETLDYRGEPDIRLAIWLARLARRHRVDIIHAHGRRGADVWAGVAARLAGVPGLVTRRVDNPESRWLGRRKYALYRQVIAISAAVEGALVDAGVPPGRIARIPDAVDTHVWRPDRDRPGFCAEFDLPDDTLLVGMVAQFIPRKGHRDLIAALGVHVANGFDVHVVLFGRGPLESVIADEVRAAGLQAHVRFAGFRTDLARLLPSLDLLVHPAHREGMGVAVLQACACSVPVIAADAGGVPEIVRDGVNGRLYAPGDVETLARLIETVGDDRPWRSAAGRRGRERMQAMFSVAGMAERYAARYRDCAGC